MIVGYARVSTDDQVLDLQIDALQKEGCEKIFKDMVSGTRADRPGLEEALSFVRAGDTLVVWRLDRLGRSLKHLIQVVERLKADGVEFKSLTEQMDTSTSVGRLVFHIFGAMAEFERSLIQERTMAGLAAARARGRHGGRPKTLNRTKVEMGRTLAQNPNLSVDQICEQLGCSRSTYYRCIRPGQ